MRDSRREIPAAVIVIAAAAIALPAAQQPTFRAEINYVELPVRVLDGKGNFIRDLKQSDFQIFEDGVPQEVAAFSLVDVPEPVSSKAASSRTAAESPAALSIASLQQLGGRLYLFVVDDYHIRPQYSFRTRQLLQSFIRERMGPNDAAAFVFTSGVRGQDFTQSSQLLLSAVGRFNGMFDSAQPDLQDIEKEVKARSSSLRAWAAAWGGRR